MFKWLKRRKKQEPDRIAWLKVLDEIRAITHRMAGQQAMSAKRSGMQKRNLRTLFESVEDTRRASDIMSTRLDGVAYRMGNMHRLVHNIQTDSHVHRRILEDIKGELADLAEVKKEEDLGPMLYEIAAGDLFKLSAQHQKYVCNSGAVYLNDVCVTGLMLPSGSCPCQHDVDTIMDWKGDCVSRITQEQVKEAIDDLAVQGGGN
jgi:hypothetical protein